MNPIRRAALSLLLLLPAAAWSQTAAPIRALFLGNSLTAGNDVPAIVAALAQLQGVSFRYDTSAPGGWNLEDHWNAGHGSLLRQADYDIVILQQGPSTLPESQVNLREWTVVWSAYARQQGALPALFMVWPTRGQTNGFALVSQSYRNAAAAGQAAVFPAGEAWDSALAGQSTLALYSDDLHATPAGSLLAGMMIGRGLFALDPARVPTRLPTASGDIVVSPAALDLFRSIVGAYPPTVLDFTATNATAPAPAAPLPAPTGSVGGAGGGGGGGGGSTPPWLALLLALGLAWRSVGVRRAPR